MKREYHKWYSPNLNRDMELLVFGHAGSRVLLFPPKNCRFFHYEDWGIVGALRQKIEEGSLQIFALDSIDQESLYCFWAHPSGRIQRHIQYENYILREVMPLSLQLNSNLCLISAGCSLGAYHAMNIALKHPQWFAKILACSGRYDITLRFGDFNDLFDGYYNQDIYYNVPSHYVPNLFNNHHLSHIRRMDISFIVGRDDIFLKNNYEFSLCLNEKQIDHKFIQWDGIAHRAPFWREMFPLYL